MSIWMVIGDDPDNIAIPFSTKDKAYRYLRRRKVVYQGYDYSVVETEIDSQDVTEDRVLFRVQYQEEPRWNGDHWEAFPSFEATEPEFVGVRQREAGLNPFILGGGTEQEIWEVWIWAESRDGALESGKGRITNAMAAVGQTPRENDWMELNRADTPFLNMINNGPPGGQHVIRWGAIHQPIAPIEVPREQVFFNYPQVMGYQQEENQEIRAALKKARLKHEQDDIMRGNRAAIDEVAHFAAFDDVWVNANDVLDAVVYDDVAVDDPGFEMVEQENREIVNAGDEEFF